MLINRIVAYGVKTIYKPLPKPLHSENNTVCCAVGIIAYVFGERHRDILTCLYLNWLSVADMWQLIYSKIHLVTEYFHVMVLLIGQQDRAILLHFH